MSLTFNANILAVLVVTVISFILGWLWYGPFFGKQWTRAVGITRREMEDSKKGMGSKMLTAFVLTLVTSYITAIFIKASGASTILSGAFVGVLVWLGFYLTTSVNGILWENKKVTFFYINTAHDLVRFIIVAAILAIWI
ncbi:MAG: DUF1761 domain-containing protein [Nanoarchaeota archaeon]